MDQLNISVRIIICQNQSCPIVHRKERACVTTASVYVYIKDKEKTKSPRLNTVRTKEGYDVG